MKIIRLLLLLALSCLPTIGAEIITQPIVLDKSDTVLDGNFRIIRVEDATNLPAIIIGDAGHTEPAFRVHNVVLKNFIIDGNKDNQKEEIWDFQIRANCITIRGAENITIQNCQVFNARSGGIVIEKGSKNIKIQNCTSSNNFFDGIAGCFSDGVEIDGCVLTHNASAGLSFDLLMTHITAKNCYVSNNNIGLFARNSSGYFIQNCYFSNSMFDLYFDQVNDHIQTKPTNIILRDNIYVKGYFNTK